MEKLQILLCGCLGRMGHAVTAAAAASADIAVAAGVDARAPQSDTPYAVIDRQNIEYALKVAYNTQKESQPDSAQEVAMGGEVKGRSARATRARSD